MDNKYWDLAARHLEGKATVSEEKELYSWMEGSPQNKAQFQAQKELWRVTAPPPLPEIDTQNAWKKIKEEIHAEKVSRQKKVLPMFPFALRVAASVAFLIGIFWMGKLIFFPYYGMEVIESGNSQLSFMLPDSSQVWLNRESMLVYDPEFDKPLREVYLEGEAFFEVKKNHHRPFLVKAKDTETKVLGTSFNLRAYPQEPTEELVVVTGKVLFSSRDIESKTVLTPGLGAKLEREDNFIVPLNNPNSNAMAWKTGRLEFNGQNLQTVLIDLERFYGVTLQLANSNIANCRFTGAFEDAKLEGVLRVLEATMQLQYRMQNEHTYIISGKECN